jgi:hypothetical protein
LEKMEGRGVGEAQGVDDQKKEKKKALVPGQFQKQKKPAAAPTTMAAASSALPANPVLLHRKLSTISSKDRESTTSPETPQNEVVFSAEVIAANEPPTSTAVT